MNTQGPGDPLDDATIVRPRQPVGARPAPAATPQPPQPEGVQADISEFLGRGLNPIVQAASPLLLLAVQLRHSAVAGDAVQLREQVMVQIRKFENRATGSGIATQTVTAARYVLCAVLDEAVLNSPWGENSGWSQKTLLVTFHGESYGGAKFFLLLDRLRGDVAKHIDLLELMYICLTLGFSGRYQIEAGGKARLGEIQDELYRQVRGHRGTTVDGLSPHWKGIEDRRNPLVRYVPLWVAGTAAACVLLLAFLWFHTRLNEVSSPIAAQAAMIGIDGETPPGDAPKATPRRSLKQLLSAEEQAGLLSVDEAAGGQATVRLNAATMFPSGAAAVADEQIPLIGRVASALEQLPGRIIVVGHTDDQPLRSLRFKDNYELSTVRARSVADALAAGLSDAGRIEVVGAGSSQPIATPPDLPENRTRNRRVEILFRPEN